MTRPALRWAGLLLFVPSGAIAATATSTFNPRITIVSQCMVSASTLDFGTVALLTSNTDTTTTLGVQCTRGTAYRIQMNSGLHATSTTNRRMKHTSANSLITYRIYRNSTRTQNWGNNNGSSVSGTGDGNLQSINVYGRVPAQTTPQQGTYTDAVTVSVIY